MARLEYAADQPPSFLARWTSRLALFCAVLLITTVFLHRLFALPTPVALNITAAAFAGAALVLVMAAIAGLDIWITGRQGAPRVIAGSVVAGALLSIALGIFLMSRDWPMLNDVSTDLTQPPEFQDAAKNRQPGSNPLAYPKDRFAELQKTSYPDLKTLILPRPASEAYELVLQALAKLRTKTVLEVPPDDDSGEPGTIELAERTMILGFAADVVIRVSGDDQTSAVDIRSASRYGRSDFGRNAERVRQIMKEIVGRLEASVPSVAKPPKLPRKKDDKLVVKRPPARDRASAAERSQRDPSRSDARREPARKASPQE